VSEKSTAAKYKDIHAGGLNNVAIRAGADQPQTSDGGVPG